MSRLNKEAFKLLLAEDDILSTPGRLQEIWEMFCMNIPDDNSNLSQIVNILESSVISKLTLQNDNWEQIATNLATFVQETSNTDVLSMFLGTCSDKLAVYLTESIKINNAVNTQINMDTINDPTYLEEASILSGLSQVGLMQDSQLQSLLDSQFFELVTSANGCMARCGNGESPLLEGRGIHNPKLLSLKEIGPDVDRIIQEGYQLGMYGKDEFSSDPNVFQKLILNEDDFKPSQLIRRDGYITNISNYGILSATKQLVKDAFDMDTNTVGYVFHLKLEEINDLLDQFGHNTALLLSKVVTLMMLIRALNSDDNQGITDDITELRTELIDTLNEFKLDLKNSFQNMPKYGTSLDGIPEPLVNFIRQADNFSIPAVNDMKSSYMGKSQVDDRINQIVTNIADISKISRRSRTAVNGLGNSSVEALSSLSGGVEQASAGKDLSQYEKVLQLFEESHTSLCESLLDCDYERSANCLAVNQVLKELLLENAWSWDISQDNECLNRIDSDYKTYGNLITTFSECGIQGYMESARATVKDSLR